MCPLDPLLRQSLDCATGVEGIMWPQGVATRIPNVSTVERLDILLECVEARTRVTASSNSL